MIGATAGPEGKGTSLGVGLIGCGNWGRNLLRNLSAAPGCDVVHLCDADPAVRARIGQTYPDLHVSEVVDALLDDPAVDAIVVATSPASHFSLASGALRAGKHALVEKPLATGLVEAEQLVRLAERLELVLMVDHTFRYSPAVEEVGRLLAEGAIGTLRHIEMERCALGQFSSEVNVAWDTALHDFTILDHWLGERPMALSARGGMTDITGTQSFAHIDLQYERGLTAHIHVSWLSPRKIRRCTLWGDLGAIVYEDSDNGPRVKTDVFEDKSVPAIGRTRSSELADVEPLARVVANFRDTILRLAPPVATGRSALPVLALLEATDRSMAGGGTVQMIHDIHPGVSVEAETDYLRKTG